MDFDLSTLTPPFRMQPGLRRLMPQATHLHALAEDDPLYVEKRALLADGSAPLVAPGFDAVPALQAIAQQALHDGVVLQTGGHWPLALREDLAVLDGASGTVPWLCVLTPSRWAPEDQVGRRFSAIHSAVAEAEALRAAAQPLVSLVTDGGHWAREVWTVSPSSRYDQHPRRHASPGWPDAGAPEAFAQGCWLRVEHQTFFPVGAGTRQAVFTIRLQLIPLVRAVGTTAQARALHGMLTSMSEAVLAYKGLTAARAPLLRWLDAKV